MDMYKVGKAQRLYGKIQGMLWNRERNCEYHHYDAAKDCERIIEDLEKQVEELGLTQEERRYAYNNMDMKVAEDVYGRY